MRRKNLCTQIRIQHHQGYWITTISFGLAANVAKQKYLLCQRPCTANTGVSRPKSLYGIEFILNFFGDPLKMPKTKLPATWGSIRLYVMVCWNTMVAMSHWQHWSPDNRSMCHCFDLLEPLNYPGAISFTSPSNHLFPKKTEIPLKINKLKLEPFATSLRDNKSTWSCVRIKPVVVTKRDTLYEHVLYSIWNPEK